MSTRKRGRTAGLAVHVGNAASVAHQTASNSILTPIIDRRHRVAVRERDKVIAPGLEQGAGADEQRIDAMRSKGRERRVDLAVGVGAQLK
jgi:hypothetical protein